jgi:hypothetical protein
MMPPQLAQAQRRRSRRSEPRPTVELLPAISINDLRDAIPLDYSTNLYSNPFRYPQVRHMRLSCRSIQIVDHNDRVQVFGIEWIRTGFGAPRAIFVCSCGYGAIRLFARYGTYACKACHRAVHMCQRQNSKGRKRLRACKLRLALGGLPDVNEPLAPKAKWRHRRTYQRLRGQVQALEAAIGSRRFRKPLETRIFAYQVS